MGRFDHLDRLYVVLIRRRVGFICFGVFKPNGRGLNVGYVSIGVVTITCLGFILIDRIIYERSMVCYYYLCCYFLFNLRIA